MPGRFFVVRGLRGGMWAQCIDNGGQSVHTALSFIRISRARYRITKVLLVRTIIFFAVMHSV